MFWLLTWLYSQSLLFSLEKCVGTLNSRVAKRVKSVNELKMSGHSTQESHYTIQQKTWLENTNPTKEWQTGNRWSWAKVASSPSTCALPRFKIQTRDWQQSAGRRYLERFLKTICRRFPLSGRQRLHSCSETWLPGPLTPGELVLVLFLKGRDDCQNDWAARRLSSRTSPHSKPAPGSGDTYFTAAYLRPTCGSREHGGSTNQRQVRGSDGCVRMGEGGTE